MLSSRYDRSRFENLPFIFLTALGDRNTELAGWGLGAGDYITKPVDLDVPAARLAARLAQGARNKSRAVSADLDFHERAAAECWF